MNYPLLTSMRQAPANIQAEQALLGAILANNKAMDGCAGLEPEHFADGIHGRIFAEARRLIQGNRLADGVTLSTVFEGAGLLNDVGGTSYLAHLMACMVGVINAPEYASTIRENAQRRTLIELGEQLVNAAFAPGSTPATDLFRDFVNKADPLLMAAKQDTSTTLGVAVAAAKKLMEEVAEGRPMGLRTGFQCIDKRLGGLREGRLYVMGGRPGQGKSSLGHMIAMNLARAGYPGLELSLEMPCEEIGFRTLSIASRVPFARLMDGSAHKSEEWAARVVKAQQEVQDLGIHIDDTAGRTPDDVVDLVRYHRRKHGILWMMVDHLSLLMATEKDARHGPTFATEKASNAMLSCAKAAGIPAILLCQLNRGLEQREDKRPGLADLRQSGAIEQDAHAVGFLYRHEYYLGKEPLQGAEEAEEKHKKRHNQWLDEKEKWRGKAELIWDKNRSGERGTDPMMFDGPTMTFFEDAP